MQWECGKVRPRRTCRLSLGQAAMGPDLTHPGLFTVVSRVNPRFRHFSPPVNTSVLTTIGPSQQTAIEVYRQGVLFEGRRNARRCTEADAITVRASTFSHRGLRGTTARAGREHFSSHASTAAHSYRRCRPSSTHGIASDRVDSRTHDTGTCSGSATSFAARNRSVTRAPASRKV